MKGVIGEVSLLGFKPEQFPLMWSLFLSSEACPVSPNTLQVALLKRTVAPLSNTYFSTLSNFRSFLFVPGSQFLGHSSCFPWGAVESGQIFKCSVVNSGGYSSFS